MLAHVAGMPIEEVASVFAPVAFVVIGLVGASVRRVTSERRAARQRRCIDGIVEKQA
jgi:hypothetical protein